MVWLWAKKLTCALKYSQCWALTHCESWTLMSSHSFSRALPWAAWLCFRLFMICFVIAVRSEHVVSWSGSGFCGKSQCCWSCALLTDNHWNAPELHTSSLPCTGKPPHCSTSAFSCTFRNPGKLNILLKKSFLSLIMANSDFFVRFLRQLSFLKSVLGWELAP